MKRLIARGVDCRAPTSGCQISSAATNFGESFKTKPGRCVRIVTPAQTSSSSASTGRATLEKRARAPDVSSGRSFVGTGGGVGNGVGDEFARGVGEGFGFGVTAGNGVGAFVISVCAGCSLVALPASAGAK